MCKKSNLVYTCTHTQILQPTVYIHRYAFWKKSECEM